MTSSLLEQLGRYVTTWSWQAAVVVLLAWCIVRFDRRNRPALRCGIWSTALICVLLLPWAPRLIASLSWTQELKAVWITSRPLQGPAGFAKPEGGFTVGPPVEKQLANIPLGSTPTARRAPASTVFLQFIGLAWTLGATFSIVRRLSLHIKMQRSVRLASRVSPAAFTGTGEASEKVPPVFLSPAVPAPSLYGLLRPVILLPVDILEWSDAEERVLMIRHECAHYLRHDHWLSAAAGVTRTLLFFHPFVLLACREFGIAREFACDEAIVQSGFEPDSYAETLIKVAEHAVRSGSQVRGVAFSSAVALNARVDRLFHPSRRVRRSIVILLPLALFTVTLAGLSFWQTPAAAAAGLPELLAPPSPPQISAPARRFEAPVLRATAVVEPPVPVLQQQPSAEPAQAEESLGLKVDQLKGPNSSTHALITVQIPSAALSWVDDTGGRIRAADGRIEMTATNIAGDVPARVGDRISLRAVLGMPLAGFTLYQGHLVLPPGLYKLDVVLTDDNNGHRSTASLAMPVQRFTTGLSLSVPILADRVEVLSPSQGQAPFQIGNLKVRPSMKGEFSRDKDMSFAFQVYGLVTDPATGGAATATVATSILSGGRQVRRMVENFPSANGMTLTKTLPLSDFEAGDYLIQVTVTDNSSGETATTTGGFKVR